MADLSGLVDALSSKGYSIEAICDGAIRRQGNEWLLGYEDGDSAWAKFGDWSRGESDVWSTGDTSFVATRSAEARAALERQWEETRGAVCKLWADLQPIGEHPYLSRKGLFELFGAKVCMGDLLVPLVDVNGRLWSLHHIGLDGQKSFHPGGRVEGCFHVMGVLQGASRVYVCEGFATGASVYVSLAKEFPVVCAMTAGNLHSVCVALRETYGAAMDISIAADNDAWGIENPGLKAAKSAASAVGGRVVYPRFRSEAGGPTDWNDLHAREGLSEVRAQIEEAEQYGKELSQLAGPKPGKPPTEDQVAHAIRAYFGEDICVHEGNLFWYCGTHWRELDIGAQLELKKKIRTLMGPLATMRLTEDVFRALKVLVPKAKGDLYQPNPFCANFQNGTLWLNRNPLDRSYRLEFREHRREDFITNALPYEYSTDWSERNKELDAMLDRVFEGDTDKADKIVALSEMYGACLVQAFPHIFFLHGENSGTGKSTAIMLAMHLVNQENTCTVEPTELKEFNMEMMVGKLVNFDTDIDLTHPIRDSIVKKIIDRVPMRINRKGIRAVMAPLPPIHIFGGNGLPKSLDGASRAYRRRVTLIEFLHVQNGGKQSADYSQYVYEQGPRGLLNFALHGLARLATSGGQFTVPSSGVERLKEWEEASDPVAHFVSEMRGDGVVAQGSKGDVLKFGEKIAGSVRRDRAYEIYAAWHLSEFGVPCKIGRNRVYKRLRGLGVLADQDSRTKVWVFNRMSLEVPEGGPF